MENHMLDDPIARKVVQLVREFRMSILVDDDGQLCATIPLEEEDYTDAEIQKWLQTHIEFARGLAVDYGRLFSGAISKFDDPRVRAILRDEFENRVAFYRETKPWRAACAEMAVFKSMTEDGMFRPERWER